MCGRNSSDAETGQVGPEVAELMGLPHVSNVRKLDVDRAGNRIVAERATDEGYQVIECPLPAVVCVTEGAGQERYPGRDEMTAAQERSIEQLTCADLTDDLSLFGLDGSPTWVEDIRLVEPDRLAVVIRDETPEDAARNRSPTCSATVWQPWLPLRMPAPETPRCPATPAVTAASGWSPNWPPTACARSPWKCSARPAPSHQSPRARWLPS